MNAGLPGLGLSGLFAMLSSLVLPFTCRRRRSRRRQIITLTVMGAVISASAVGSWDLLLAAAGGTHSRQGTASSSWLGPVPVMGVSLGILVLIVLTVEVLSLVIEGRKTPTPPPVPEPDQLAPEPV